MKKEYDLKKLKRRPGKVKVDKSASKIPISIRLDGYVLGEIKYKAHTLGIPYQTLVGSILHQYVYGDLISTNSLDLLKKSKAS